ncbi:MAG: peptidylprolyl isomerase [Bacteroidetes bacterium]|nr:peptidylprolyl isomerase [Bacteroidota bacterium]
MKTIILLLIAPFILITHTKSKPIISTIIIKKDAKKLCEYYRQRVLRGESMASIAKLYSEDPGSAPNGGQYDGIVKGVMVTEFENVAFSLKPGEISEVFETQYGFHFIQLISRKGDTLSLRHLLITRD